MAAFERPDCILSIGRIINICGSMSQRYYVQWTECDIMDPWDGKRCESPFATCAVTCGYRKLRTRRIVRPKSAAPCCGTRAALMGGRGQRGSRRGEAGGSRRAKQSVTDQRLRASCLAAFQRTRCDRFPETMQH